MLARLREIDWLFAFAERKGLPVAIWEWGIVQDGRDIWGPYVNALSSASSRTAYSSRTTGTMTATIRARSDTRATDVAAVKAAIAPPVVAPAPAAVPAPAPVKAAPPSRPATPDRMTIMASGPSALLVVRVSADCWQGRPKFTVKVDGVQVGGTLVATDGVIGVPPRIR